MIGQKWLRKMELKKKIKDKKGNARYESKIDGILMKYAWVCNDVVSKEHKKAEHMKLPHTVRWT